MPVCIHRPFALLIRGAVDAEINIFSIAVERSAMENQSVLLIAGQKTNML
jgi:hypothetical protein